MRRILLISAVALGACVKSGPQPIPPAAEEDVQASVRVTEAAALKAVTDLGLPIEINQPGLIETRYFDIVSYRPEADVYPRSERLVRFRVIVTPDSSRAGAHLAVLSMYSPFTMGSGRTVSRRDERPTPRDHPANDLVDEIVDKAIDIAEGR